MAYSPDYEKSFLFLWYWEVLNPKPNLNSLKLSMDDLKEQLYDNIWIKYCSKFEYPLNLVILNTYYDFEDFNTNNIINKCLKNKFLINCICEERLRRRLHVLPLYKNRLNYNFLALYKDLVLKELTPPD